MIQFTEVFCFQGVASKNFFNLGLDVRWLLPIGRHSVGLLTTARFFAKMAIYIYPVQHSYSNFSRNSMAKVVRNESAKPKPQHRNSVSPKEKDALGREGEKAAADFLTEKGYKILQQNYLLPDGEIDIAAMDGQTLVIVEVKTRKNNNFGKPYEAVTETKQRRMVKLAGQFMYRFRLLRKPVRFDIVSITGTSPDDFVIEHFAEAFNPRDLQ